MELFNKESELKKIKLTAKAGIITVATNLAGDILKSEASKDPNRTVKEIVARYDELTDAFVESLEVRQGAVFEEAETLAKSLESSYRSPKRGFEFPPLNENE